MPQASRALIDASALLHNLAQLRGRAGNRKLLLAVKANAYGHGAVEVSRLVEREQAVDWLAVASVDEGVELRENGIELPILKLSHCFADEVSEAIEHRITLTIVDEASADEAEAAAAALGLAAPVHLKVDTGMRRIGVEPSGAVGLAQHIAGCEHLELQGIFTHLPVSDCADGLDFTRDQMALFARTVAEVEEAIGAIELVHCANSGALGQHDLGVTTMARCGISAYGYQPDATTRRTVELRPVMSWLSRVSFVKQVAAGQSVGYGRTWVAPRDTWIATVPVGYGDGYPRVLSNKGRMLIGGRSVPIVGRVCMDQTMVDLGPDGGDVQRGDEVVLLGVQGDEQITADELAEKCGTISYEILCNPSSRVPRVMVK